MVAFSADDAGASSTGSAPFSPPASTAIRASPASCGDAASVVARPVRSATATTPRRCRPNGASRRRRAARAAYARHISDFIAGMTDRYALAEHRRLFDATPDLR